MAEVAASSTAVPKKTGGSTIMADNIVILSNAMLVNRKYWKKYGFTACMLAQKLIDGCMHFR